MILQLNINFLLTKEIIIRNLISYTLLMISNCPVILLVGLMLVQLSWFHLFLNFVV